MNKKTKTLKEKAFQIVQERNLTSVMNKTKWNELRISMLEETPFPPPYIIKFLFDKESPEETIFQHIPYLGNWHESYCYPPFFNASFTIEWIKIRPYYYKSQGLLLDSKIVDATETFLKILEKHSIPFEEENGIYTIFGYK